MMRDSGQIGTHYRYPLAQHGSLVDRVYKLASPPTSTLGHADGTSRMHTFMVDNSGALLKASGFPTLEQLQ